MSDDEIVSPLLAKELNERIAKVGGDILAVRHEIEDELHAIEKEAMATGKPEEYSLKTSFILSQIEYLDAKLQEAGKKPVEKHEGLVDRIRHLFHKNNE
ncbi:MAG: hypothetical protein GXP38_02800 [Chloroflexi bacterium]|nr:hypothetical protein [Chloroflexota bacterium]